MEKTFVVIPTYNESANIKNLIDEILSLDKSFHIVVVDDDSPDGTWKIVEELSKKHKHIHLLLRKGSKGRGLAGIDGFKYALRHGAEIIIEIDADFSHHPKHIPQFLDTIKYADVVIGSRFAEGGSDKRVWKRKYLTVLCNAFANVILNLNLTDPNSGYRCYKRNVLEAIVPKLTARGADIVQDIIFNCKKNGFKIIEIPIDFEDRKLGDTTKTAKDFINGIKTCLKLRFSR